MFTRINLRRAGAALIAPALAAGMVVAAPSAQAAPNSYAYSAARWLSDQLEEGLIVSRGSYLDEEENPVSYEFKDYGLTIDVFFALKDLDTRAGDRAKIISALETDPAAYTTDPYDPGSAYAGATGKLAAAVQASAGDPAAFGGHNLISEAEARVQPSGRATDVATYNGAPADYSNSIGQSWVVRALATADSTKAGATVDYLLKQQCNDGSFRSVMNDATCTTEAGTIDATALAIQALGVAKAKGQADLQDDIDDAVRWLLKQQAANGSFVNDDSANTNSTGLAAATLKTVGQVGAAGSAAAWIVSHQVTDANAEDSKLANELGAIAFDQGALNRGKTAGITTATRDQWVRASAQAAVGVNAQLSAKKFTAKAPAGYLASGSTISVSATGLAAGEKFTASVVGGTTVTGTATAAGVASAKVKTGGGTATRAVTIKGSRSNRVGTTAVNLLAAKKLTVKLSSKVKKNKKQTVKVSGLAPRETVKIYVAGKLVKTYRANVSGKYNYSFKVGKKAGKKTVKVVGAFKNRSGSKSFRVK